MFPVGWFPNEVRQLYTAGAWRLQRDMFMHVYGFALAYFRPRLDDTLAFVDQTQQYMGSTAASVPERRRPWLESLFGL